MIQVFFVPRKSIFDPFDQKWPARMVTVKASPLSNLFVSRVEINEIG